jgi:hypothetical protein
MHTRARAKAYMILGAYVDRCQRPAHARMYASQCMCALCAYAHSHIHVHTFMHMDKICGVLFITP